MQGLSEDSLLASTLKSSTRRVSTGTPPPGSGHGALDVLSARIEKLELGQQERLDRLEKSHAARLDKIESAIAQLATHMRSSVADGKVVEVQMRRVASPRAASGN